MPEDEGFVFTEAGTRRIVDAVRRVERMPQNIVPLTTRTLDVRRVYLGKTDAAHAKGAMGTVSIWSGTKGSETDTTINTTSVYNRMMDIATGKWVHFGWIDGGFELIGTECST